MRNFQRNFKCSVCSLEASSMLDHIQTRKFKDKLRQQYLKSAHFAVMSVGTAEQQRCAVNPKKYASNIGRILFLLILDLKLIIVFIF